MPSVDVFYSPGTNSLIVDATGSTTVTSVTTTGGANQFTITFGGTDTFNIVTGHAGISGNGANTLSVDTSQATVANLDLELKSGQPLAFGLGSSSGVGNVKIDAPGDSVGFNALTISGYLKDNSGPVTVIGAMVAGGSVRIIGAGAAVSSVDGNLTIKGSGAGSGNDNQGVYLSAAPQSGPPAAGP